MTFPRVVLMVLLGEMAVIATVEVSGAETGHGWLSLERNHHNRGDVHEFAAAPEHITAAGSSTDSIDLVHGLSGHNGGSALSESLLCSICWY
jgi:hypothetical protein